jgi:alkylation response protein AidB-like acyl-CoA dehydrogenase
MFIQETPPPVENLFRRDALLKGLTKHGLSEDAYLLLIPKLENFADEIILRIKDYAHDAETHPPRLENCDVYGHRVDRLHLHPSWLALRKFALQNRLVAMGYDKKLRQGRRLAQAAFQIMFSAYSSNYSCPLAMTDGAIKLLSEHAPKSMREEIIHELLSKATCGQWMTERIGGSDLQNIETHASLARKVDDKEHYRLYGVKWFASAVDSNYALVLAQIPEAGPSLFLLPVWQEGRLCEGISLDRLKNKLGTKALPTAEVRLEGALATLIGVKGRGISCAAPILNITRFYNALASASIMNRAFYGALEYAQVRYSFGKSISEHTLHRRLLADLDAKRSGAMALCFELASLLGRVEEGLASSKEKKCLRALVPLAKLTLGKWAVLVASDALEAIGGLGYMEDSEYPRLLRDAQVLPIWEGTTSILLLDLLRAERKDNALITLLQNLCERVNEVQIDESDALRILKARLQQVSEKVVAALNKGEDSELYLEPFIRRCAFSISACTMALLLAETKPFITELDEFASTRFTTFVENNLCGHFSL